MIDCPSSVHWLLLPKSTGSKGSLTPLKVLLLGCFHGVMVTQMTLSQVDVRTLIPKESAGLFIARYVGLITHNADKRRAERLAAAVRDMKMEIRRGAG